MRTELTPVYDRCKSFYKKAYVEEDGNEVRLYSYDSHVATIKEGSYILHSLAACSMTTRRHVNEFLAQNGFQTLCKKEMEKEIREGFLNLLLSC